MNLDIRLPIGLMFSLFGLLLVAVGVMPDAENHKQSLGININLWWGVVMALFGGFMLYFAWKGSQSAPEPTKDSGQPAAHRK
jgi:hypothetical protein